MQQIEVIDIWPIFKRKPPKISTQEKATSRLAFGGKNEKSCYGKRAIDVGGKVFLKCYRWNESSLEWSTLNAMSCPNGQISFELG